MEGASSGTSLPTVLLSAFLSCSLALFHCRDGRHLLRFDYACWRDWSVLGVNMAAVAAETLLCHLEGESACESVCLQIEHFDALSPPLSATAAVRFGVVDGSLCIVPSSPSSTTTTTTTSN